MLQALNDKNSTVLNKVLLHKIFFWGCMATTLPAVGTTHSALCAWLRNEILFLKNFFRVMVFDQVM